MVKKLEEMVSQKDKVISNLQQAFSNKIVVSSEKKNSMQNTQRDGQSSPSSQQRTKANKNFSSSKKSCSKENPIEAGKGYENYLQNFDTGMSGTTSSAMNLNHQAAASGLVR